MTFHLAVLQDSRTPNAALSKEQARREGACDTGFDAPVVMVSDEKSG